ncbi:hypothetical protein KSP39_PZI012470 [Platanthera zijinensis]|uniref:Uncharacterized protein n=1 Tax=Platanthera zijinensis TaxID=2320716 RepID=A0AAP0BEN7_9ASPA
MGCGTSRLEPGEEIPTGLLPLRRRILELKRAHPEAHLRQRKDYCIIPTPKVLRPEERDNDECDVVGADRTTKDQSEEEQRQIGFGRDQKEGSEAKEELMGSPSFRFYVTNTVDRPDDDHSTDSLGLGSKTLKKEKARRFIALQKPNFLNVRGCYNINSCSLHSQEAVRILDAKDA